MLKSLHLPCIYPMLGLSIPFEYLAPLIDLSLRNAIDWFHLNQHGFFTKVTAMMWTILCRAIIFNSLSQITIQPATQSKLILDSLHFLNVFLLQK